MDIVFESQVFDMDVHLSLGGVVLLLYLCYKNFEEYFDDDDDIDDIDGCGEVSPRDTNVSSERNRDSQEVESGDFNARHDTCSQYSEESGIEKDCAQKSSVGEHDRGGEYKIVEQAGGQWNHTDNEGHTGNIADNYVGLSDEEIFALLQLW